MVRHFSTEKVDAPKLSQELKMDHIGAILAEQHDTIVSSDSVVVQSMTDGFPKLKQILTEVAEAVSELTCKKSLADGKFGINRFHGVLSFQSNKFLVQYVNESSMGFETLVRVYDYTYNKDQLFVTKFKHPKPFSECIQEQEDVFKFDDMMRWRWEIRNMCKCCDLAHRLAQLEELATEIDKMIARSSTITD